MNNCKGMQKYYKRRVISIANIFIRCSINIIPGHINVLKTVWNLPNILCNLQWFFSRVISFLIENTREVHLINEDC